MCGLQQYAKDNRATFVKYFIVEPIVYGLAWMAQPPEA